MRRSVHGFDGRSERGYGWMSEQRAQRWLREHPGHAYVKDKTRHRHAANGGPIARSSGADKERRPQGREKP